MMTRCRRLSVFALMLVCIGVADADWAFAQSAADKATARQLATDGIQLFRQDRYSDALDKLERAQALYDAPVHLLYIARCQAKLNRLVESAEAYRRLVRVELSAQAPQTFKDAVADGQKELAEVEPKVPVLRVEVVPSNAKDLKFTIDGDPVSTAVLGVDRPINPGSHQIEVSVKGHPPVTKRVDVAVASKQVVRLELPAAASGGTASDASEPTQAPPTVGDRTVAGEPAVAGTSTMPNLVDSADPSRDEREWRRFKILAGVDIAGAMPLAGKLDGQVGTGPADDRAVTGRYGPGAGLELRLGVSLPVSNFAIAPLLFVNAHSHDPGPLYKKSADRSFSLPNIDSIMTAEPVSVALGFGARINTVPTRALQLGGFGELGMVFQDYSTTGTWSVTDKAAAGSCEFAEAFTGFGARTRGGLLLPVSRLVTLVGAAGITIAKVTSAGMTSKSCDRTELLQQFRVSDKASVPAADRTYHAVLGLTLGAEFGIGIGR